MHQIARRPVWQGRVVAVVLLLMAAVVMLSTFLTSSTGGSHTVPRVTVDLSRSVGG